MSDKLNILLVEDDFNLGLVVQDTLKREGFNTHLCRDGKEGLQQFNAQNYDLCVLDVMLPEKDGFSLAEDIRKVNENVPIIFLTAKNMMEDKVRGFESGGDDYLTKPFSNEEFLLRVKALLKRSGKVKKDENKHVHQIGEYTYDSLSFLLRDPMGEERKLTKKEASVLKLLCEHKNKVIERALLLNLIWGKDDYFTGRSLDVFITKLRKYLKEDESIQILNMHGVGFKLDCN
ncbi:MAG: response regulator transcription factor [Bacteroidota bacterium]